MAQFTLDMNNCPMCASTGPALLPARYAVVTDNITTGIPSWARPQNCFPQAKGYDYALRALRQGFVYVFYELSQQWDAWAVSEDGSVWKQPSAAYAKAKKSPDCSSPQHNTTHVEIMILRDDALQGNTWLAFSPSKWSADALERYTNETEKRHKRMQCLEYWQWSTPENSQGVTAASPGSLENILDYVPLSPSHASLLLPYNPAVRRISQTENAAPWYKFEENEVKPQGTIYPWSKTRAGHVRQTLKALQARGQGQTPYGHAITPLVMALNDPIGIAHELAGFGDDYAGLHATWLDELSIEFMTLQSLAGAKNQIQQMGKAIAERHTLDAYQSTANYGMNKVSGSVGHIVPTALSQRQTALNELMQQANIDASQQGEKAFATSWKKYETQLNQAKIDAFNTCYSQFCSMIASKLELLATLRVAWLKHELFITSSQDFYSSCVADNLSYREAVDYGMASLNLTDKGSAFLDELLEQYSAQSETNIAWRSLMLNNPDVISETRGLLQLMVAHKGVNIVATESSFIDAISTYMGKFTDAYDKANELVDKSPSANTSFSRLMLATDRRLSTLGQRAFRVTGGEFVLNHLNTQLKKSLFLIAAGVPVDKAQALCLSDIRAGDPFRKQLALAMQMKKSADDLDINNGYKRNFDNFAKTAEGEKTIRASRIKLLLLFFNGMEYAKQLSDSKGDAKSFAQVSAAFLATLSTATELVEPLIKHGLEKELLATSVKLIGLNAATIASALNLGFDGSNVINEIFCKKESRWVFVGMCTIKSVVDIGVVLKTVGGLLDVLIKNTLLSADRVIVNTIIKISLWNVVAWVASWQVMIFIYVLERLYAAFIDNELQAWCREGVFGIDPDVGLISTECLELPNVRAKSYTEQVNKIEKALGAII
ncbi:T6SS effector BTH_I2691 family protein [Acerihabitans sp. TG2]|uniref:T6SS effector BTH_I2691 family protein n=1 Tax=Acerihabitans sp. TG2 TaxID=3096008 RepID=UPI002B2288A0|nr:T6SS effector BTH_I2691 family protein [Acerihabitans sp. TG2]MEA9393586.1 T6SS effector BTH_I2691 family protein [Acerihabitans sp. TG2]